MSRRTVVFVTGNAKKLEEVPKRKKKKLLNYLLPISNRFAVQVRAIFGNIVNLESKKIDCK